MYWLDIYFSGKAPDFTPPLEVEATPFRKSVWEILLTIPFGSTMTYGQIADRLAAKAGKQKMSARAVGVAVGRNPISIIIPCHRVGGYRYYFDNAYSFEGSCLYEGAKTGGCYCSKVMKKTHKKELQKQTG